jgi:hypothetical protein
MVELPHLRSVTQIAGLENVEKQANFFIKSVHQPGRVRQLRNPGL